MEQRFTGLSQLEANERLKQYGQNTLPKARTLPWWRRLFKQFQSPLIYILLAALMFDLVTWLIGGGEGIPIESVAIAALLALNASLGMVQEFRAERALERIEDLSAPRSFVFRDEHWQNLPSSELVLGDLIRLEAGTRVPADASVLDEQGLLLDESLLTGESVPIDKTKHDEVFAGTLVVRGQGLLEVTRTGTKSAMGKLATLLDSVTQEKTPLEKRLEKFSAQLAKWVLLLAVVLVVFGVVAEGIGSFARITLFAVALAVAAVPEGLPAVLTTTLALGTERMAKRKAVVRRLAAVEALGSVTVIASDKTGTITENRMEVKEVDTADVKRLHLAMTLVNDAEDGVGDPLEQALLHYVRSQGVNVQEVRSRYPRSSTRPFDSDWKFMRVTVSEKGSYISYLKGAPEVLLERSNLDKTAKDLWLAKLQRYASDGYRTLAFAWAEGERETHLHFLGLVLFWDPPRAEAAAAIAKAKAAGIRVIMMTGDHPATARAIAESEGIDGLVSIGADLDGLSSDDVKELVKQSSVFARVTPEHKLKLVEALQASGEVVAVTGDGVNDAPALKRSDVGVAMGQRGSDVAREVADLVLLDDNFATIVAAIEEGRNLYSSIQSFVRFLLATNLAEVTVVTLGLFAAYVFGLRDVAGAILLPLTATQILWINLVTDSLPALALALDRHPAAMLQPPRASTAPLLDKRSFRFLWQSALFLSVLPLATLALLPHLGFATQAQTTAFVLLVFGQLLYSFTARRLEGQPPTNYYLWLALLVSLVLQCLILFVPALRELLGLQPLSFALLLWSVVGALLAWLGSLLTLPKPH